jgi:hypothetical protein
MGLKEFASELPVIGGLFDSSTEDALAKMQDDYWLWNQNRPKDFAYDEYSPELFDYAGDYNPYTMTAQTVQDDPNLRAGQLSYLTRLSGLADTGLDAEDEAAFMRAQTDAGQFARGRSSAIMADAARRGVASGGAALALQEMAGQDGAQRAQQAGLERAATAAKQRALYTQAYGDALGTVRGQDAQIGKTNADIIKQINRYNTDAMNQAMRFNLENRQDVSNKNTATKNDAERVNIDNRYKTQQGNYDRQMEWLQGTSGNLRGQANVYKGNAAQNAQSRGSAGDFVGKGISYIGDQLSSLGGQGNKNEDLDLSSAQAQMESNPYVDEMRKNPYQMYA